MEEMLRSIPVGYYLVAMVGVIVLGFVYGVIDDVIWQYRHDRARAAEVKQQAAERDRRRREWSEMCAARQQRS